MQEFPILASLRVGLPHLGQVLMHVPRHVHEHLSRHMHEHMPRHMHEHMPRHVLEHVLARHIFGHVLWLKKKSRERKFGLNFFN